MIEHFNKLSPAEDERLAMLAEECAEVIQIISKIQRHGYESWHPDDPKKTTNRVLLRKELTDMAAVKLAMIRSRDIGAAGFDEIDEAWDRKLRFAHHQEQP